MRTTFISFSRSPLQTSGNGEKKFQTSVGTTTFAYPVRFVTGVHSITRIIVTDAAGNFRTYFAGDLGGIAVGGTLSLTVNQPTAPATKLINLVSYVHAPLTIDITGTNTARVTYTATLEGDYSAAVGRPSVRAYLTSADSRCNARSVTLTYKELASGNTVYETAPTYAVNQFCKSTYTVVYVSIDDQYQSRNVYGSCPASTTTGTVSSTGCSDPRVEPASAAGTLQASALVVALAALLAALLA
jgi:hypothetical protein